MATSPAERRVVVVRTDGDRAVGLGHVRRCLALAAELAPWLEVRFCLKGSEEVAGLVRREGFACVSVGVPFEETLAALGAAGAAGLIADSYEVGAGDLDAARPRVSLLVVLDDSGRCSASADLVINPAPAARPPGGPTGTRYLLGPPYALLRPEFAAVPAREVQAGVGRVLLTLGGATPAPLMAAVAGAARRALPDAAIEVVVGPLGDGPEVVAAALDGIVGVTMHAAPEDICALMLMADLAVSGGGVTLFELAATGTPAIGVELAPNQGPNLAGMAAAGALVVAGKADEAGLGQAVARHLTALADPGRRQAMSRAGHALVDGRGAARVAEAIRGRIAGRSVSEPSVCAG